MALQQAGLNYRNIHIKILLHDSTSWYIVRLQNWDECIVQYCILTCTLNIVIFFTQIFKILIKEWMRGNNLKPVTKAAGQLILRRPAESIRALLEFCYPVCSVILLSEVFHCTDQLVKEI